METINKKIKNALYAFLIVGMTGSISACNNNRTSDSVSTNDTEMQDDASATNADVMDIDENAWMQERDDFITGQRDLSMRMENTIAEQERALEKMSGKSNAAMKEGINSLKTKKKNLDTKLNEAEQASRESWQDFRAAVSEASTELEKSWEAFAKEYNIQEPSNQ